jgi:hypothetical protein
MAGWARQGLRDRTPSWISARLRGTRILPNQSARAGWGPLDAAERSVDWGLVSERAPVESITVFCERSDHSLSVFPPSTNGHLSCQNLSVPGQAPNGILLTTGSVAQSPGSSCFSSLDPTHAGCIRPVSDKCSAFRRATTRHAICNPLSPNSRSQRRDIQSDVNDAIALRGTRVHYEQFETRSQPLILTTKHAEGVKRRRGAFRFHQT